MSGKTARQKRSEVVDTYEQRLRAAIARSNLSSVMNTTKWKKLLAVLEPLSDLIDVRRKDVREAVATDWKADIYEMLGLSQSIEWFEIKPQSDKGLPDIARAVDDAGIPFSVEDGAIRVWGYTRDGSQPRWYRGEAV